VDAGDDRRKRGYARADEWAIVADRITMTKAGSHLALLILLSRPFFSQSPYAQQFAEAERQIVRLPPTGFPEIPRNVVQELNHRGCTIPQKAFTKKRNNVIQGEFARPGQKDLAVLCSVRGMSTILVFWRKSEKDPAAIAPMEDRIFLQDMGGGKIGFSRDISPMGKDAILHLCRVKDEPVPLFLLTHQGLDDAFIGKASQTYYFHKGKWLIVTGSD